MGTMVMEANPEQVLLFTNIAFAVAGALALALYIGVEWEKFQSKLPSSILGILASLAFAIGLTPWTVIAEEFGLELILNCALCALGLIVLALCVRIKHQVVKPTRRFSVAAYDPTVSTSK